ncbi:MAG: hypothetical protein ACOVRN_05385 [Flavobacterium sp.]
MDDFVLSNLHEARNEWCSRLVCVFTPLVIEGIRSIFNESWKLCIENDEASKYLMTFQNLISRVPKWNANIIEEERKRIVERSGCNYLDDLITCVHIIQLKVLTCIRVGNKQKKIDITTPNLDSFIHKVYINVARKCYTNVYLFEKNISPLLSQRNNRELELIVQECILNTIRDSIPTEAIIRAYMDEAVEQEEEVIIENIEPEKEPEQAKEVEKEPAMKENHIEDTPQIVPSISNMNNDPVVTKLTFNDYDSVLDMGTGRASDVNAPKSIDRLEEISTARAIQRKLEEESDDDDDDRIKIHTDSIDLGEMDVFDVDRTSSVGDVITLDGVEEL